MCVRVCVCVCVCVCALTLRLLVAMVQRDVCGVVHAGGQVLCGAFAKLVDAEDDVINVGHAVNVVLKHIDAERMVEHCKLEMGGQGGTQ